MKTRRPSRLRRVAKWVGLGVCVVSFLLWIASIQSRYVRGSRDDRVFWAGGALLIRLEQGWSDEFSYGPLNVFGFPRILKTPGGAVVEAGGIVFRFPRKEFLVVPIWVLVAGSLFCTVFLFYTDRRRVPCGHCLHCGYNLTGNESGKCPECATPVPKQEAAP